MSCEQATPLDVVVANERLDAMRELLADYSDKDRELMHLLYVACRSAEETAREMGISVKTVYSKKHKIRARLREQLASREAA